MGTGLGRGGNVIPSTCIFATDANFKLVAILSNIVDLNFAGDLICTEQLSFWIKKHVIVYLFGK